MREKTPESPAFEIHTPLKDNKKELYKSYEDHLATFVIVKVEPKRIAPTKRKLSFSEEIQQVEPDSNRRKSNRIHKSTAKKYESQLQDVKVVNPVDREEIKPPPKKRPRLDTNNTLETIEELFVCEVNDDRFLFKGVSKFNVCALLKCLKPSPDLIKCLGKCGRSFHANCFDSESSDTKICLDCTLKIEKCFACSKVLTDSDEKLECQHTNCEKVYHKKCLSQWPASTSKASTDSKFICPQHNCNACSARITLGKQNFVKSGSLVACMLCPASFHQFVTCTPGN